MPRSRLPSPPSSKGPKEPRPLPPEPSGVDAPPPLPARPPGPGGPSRGGQPQPPKSRPLPPPVTQEDSDDDNEQATYEEPEQYPPAPPPSSVRKPPPPVQEESMGGGGEIYDDLDEVIEGELEEEDDTYDPPDDEQQETYDECEIKEAKVPPKAKVTYQEEIQEDLYELPPDDADQSAEEEELIQETEYEFVPADNNTPSPPPPRAIPPPPVPAQPSLPARPPLSKKDSGSELTPDLPTRPPAAQSGGGKKQLPAGAPVLGISLGALSNAKGRLRKVSSEDKKDSFEASEGSGGSLPKADNDSFKGRMNMFKEAEDDDTDSSISGSGQPYKQALKPPNHNSPSMSPRSPGRKSPIPDENISPNIKPAAPADLSKLTIKERIALMQGKNIGGVTVQPSAEKPAIAKKPPTFRKPEGLGQVPVKDPPQASPKSNGPYKEEPKPVSDGPRPWNSTPKQKKPDSPPPPPPPEPELEEDDIYDEGFTYKPPPDPLAEFEWYHRDLDRHMTESKLNAIGQDGSFMVRKSQRGGDNQPYTLVVLYRGHVYNLKIRKRPDTKVALGEVKPDELAFKDVPALITYHRNNDVVLVNMKENKQYKTLLTKFPAYNG